MGRSKANENASMGPRFFNRGKRGLHAAGGELGDGDRDRFRGGDGPKDYDFNVAFGDGFEFGALGMLFN